MVPLPICQGSFRVEARSGRAGAGGAPAYMPGKRAVGSEDERERDGQHGAEERRGEGTRWIK